MTRQTAFFAVMLLVGLLGLVSIYKGECFTVGATHKDARYGLSSGCK